MTYKPPQSKKTVCSIICHNFTSSKITFSNILLINANWNFFKRRIDHGRY